MVSEASSAYESQWAATTSIAAKIGCTSEALRRWGRQQERDTGQRPGPTSAEEERIKALGREVREPAPGDNERRPHRAHGEAAPAEFAATTGGKPNPASHRRPTTNSEVGYQQPGRSGLVSSRSICAPGRSFQDRSRRLLRMPERLI